jgi:fructose-1,6-bisphosphatase/inositol monophosphatase family enzyme
MGSMDMVVETRLKAWDIESTVPLIAGAGGVVSDWRGERLGRNGGQVAIAGDRACLEQALAALSPAAK